MMWLISGSRDFPDEKLARHVFKSQFKKGDIVVHGGARGVDTWAAEEALKKGAARVMYRADWDKHGKSAGIKRNRHMFDEWYAEEGPKRALIVWDGISMGTKHMLGIVEHVGVPLTLIKAGYD